MFDRKDIGGFALMGVVALILNILFWGALLVGALYILRAFEVI